MKTVLTLIICLGLGSLASAAPPDPNNPQPGKKKGGGGNAPQQVNVPQGGKKFKATGPGMNSHVQNFQQQSAVGNPNAFKKNKYQGNFQQQNAVGNPNAFKKNKLQGPVTGQGGGVAPANNTSFNKTKNVNINKNITVNKNFKVQKFNLGNKPIGKYQAVKFNQNFKFAGANKWKGSKYQVFVNYHPAWHDQWWWNQHHSHITIVFGAPYYWDAGYWYPAWGYDPGAEYYFDGPIYSSNPEMDPGQVVANVQSALQQQGFYQGEVDGVLGPQTRAALAEYQSAQGIEPTGAIDEPTLETLGMA